MFWYSGASRVAWIVRCMREWHMVQLHALHWAVFVFCIPYFDFCILAFWSIGGGMEEGMAHRAASCLTLVFVFCNWYLYFVFWHSRASRVAWMVHEGMAHGAASCLTFGGVARRAKVLPNPANMCQHYLTPPLPRIGPAPVQKGLNRRFCNIYGYTHS